VARGNLNPRLSGESGLGTLTGEPTPFCLNSKTLELAIDPAELAKIVDSAMRDDAPASQDGAALVRLEIIDLALYQAICQHPELLRALIGGPLRASCRRP